MDIQLITLSSYVKPPISEDRYNDWVLNGKKNYFYQYIIDRNNGSPTNASINNTYASLIYGRGLSFTNGNVGVNNFALLQTYLRPKELRKVIIDFQVFNEFAVQVIRKRGGGLSSIKHIPKQLVAPSIKNENGEIDSYWYCEDWSNTTKYKPQKFASFGTSRDAIEIYVGKPYRVGDEYFTSPDYLSGLQYAEMEEEISNLNISSIKNGLSAGYIINIPDGKSWTPEDKQKFKDKVKRKLTGSPNASDFILSFNGRDVEISITPFPVNKDIHKQWDFLTREAKNQIMTAHRVISPSLVGLSSASGFSSVADEMDMSEKQTMKRVIKPKQDFILESIEEIIAQYDINLNLYFLPLTEDEQEPVTTEDGVSENVEMSSDSYADEIISLGDDEVTDYDLIDEIEADDLSLTENTLNKFIHFAVNTPNFDKPRRTKSEQDTSLFKIRYRYAGNKNPEREFCRKMMAANKVYRAEDLNKEQKTAPNMGAKGSDTYNVFLYKGGVNCKHFFMREIYMKKGYKKISVNQARKLILELDPRDRKDARWQTNPKEVAQIAEKSNNYWSLDPNYRKK